MEHRWFSSLFYKNDKQEKLCLAPTIYLKTMLNSTAHILENEYKVEFLDFVHHKIFNLLVAYISLEKMFYVYGDQRKLKHVFDACVFTSARNK